MEFRVLLIEDSRADAKLIRNHLKSGADGTFLVDEVRYLNEGIKRLETDEFDLVLLDLRLPDSQGIDSFHRLHIHCSGVPIVVLTGLDDDQLGIACVQAGAQDYLEKDKLHEQSLRKSIRYAIERNSTEEQIRELNANLEHRVLELAAANDELNKLTIELAIARDEALQLSRSKSEFVAKMSHELRTPTAAIIGLVELALADPGSRKQEELLTLTFESGRSLLDIVNETLELYQLEEGAIEISMSEFSPVQLVESTADLLATAAARKGIYLMTFIDPSIPPVLRGDFVRLRQVLVNLLGNAIKFTERGEVLVKAKLERTDQIQSLVRFSVTDTGIGLSPVDKECLFQPFVEVGSSINQGTGLGLSICKRIVAELMNGTIDVNSIEGCGSTFWFEVPLKHSKEGHAENIFSLQFHSHGTESSSVLFVSRNANACDIISRYLTVIGARAGIAESIEDCIEKLERAVDDGKPYRLAIVDNFEWQEESEKLANRIRENLAISRTKLVLLRGIDSQENSFVRNLFNKSIIRPLKQQTLLDIIEGEVEADGKPAIAGSQAIPSHRPGRILVAEDNPLLRLLFKRAISGLGYETHVVENGREAVDAASSTKYSLILMDLQMPEMDGVAATVHIRKNEQGRRRCPIIAITASSLRSERERCQAAGMDDYLVKPVSLERLRESIETWMSVAAESPID